MTVWLAELASGQIESALEQSEEPAKRIWFWRRVQKLVEKGAALLQDLDALIDPIRDDQDFVCRE